MVNALRTFSISMTPRPIQSAMSPEIPKRASGNPPSLTGEVLAVARKEASQSAIRN